MRCRRLLPPPARLKIGEQMFLEKYRPIVESVEGQTIRGAEHVVNRLGYVVTEQPWSHRNVVDVRSTAMVYSGRSRRARWQ